MKNKIYLDNAATTICDSEVIDAMLPYLKTNFGNPSSQHGFGQVAKTAVERSREQIAEMLNAEPYEIIFTSGGTEAINHAIKGVAFYQKRFNKKLHIIASEIEHPAVLQTLKYLEDFGFEISFIKVDENGKINLNDLQNNIRPTTALICVMHANNEIGTIQPINEINNIAKRNNIILFSDTVQSIGKMPFNFSTFNADLCSISAHKINGPKGIGALLLKRGVEFDSLIHGGSQEKNHRGGTENVAAIVGFAKALSIWIKNQNQYSEYFKNLKLYLINKFKLIDGIIINGDENNSLNNILSVSIDSSKIKIDGEMFLINLDLHGLAVSSGSACSSGSAQSSHVIRAIGRNEKTNRATVRFSFGKDTTKEEVVSASEIFLEVLKKWN